MNNYRRFNLWSSPKDSTLPQTMFLVVALYLVLMPPLPSWAQEKTYEIQLKSRTFTPTAGIPQSTMTAHSRALNQQPCTHAYVQFNTLPTNKDLQTLKTEGIELLEYIGGKAYVAHMCETKSLAFAEREVARTGSSIRWIGRVQPEDKLDLTVQTGKLGKHARYPDGSVKLRIHLYKDVDFGKARRAIIQLVKVLEEESEQFKSLTVRVDMDTVKKLAQLDMIQSIAQASPPKARFNDGIRANLGADELQHAPFNLSGRGVKAGIWDGGKVASTHPDFAGRLTIIDTQSATDRHGTHVAGTMGGDGTNSQSQGGVSGQWKGVAPGVEIFSYDWNSPTDEHDGAINQKGIDLSQNSWGYTVEEGFNNCSFYGDYEDTAREYDEIVTGKFGKRISILFAAANERDDADCNMNPDPPFLNYGNIPPPQTAKNIITVGAVNSDDNSMTTFSSWGPVDDGRIKPEVVAPGCERGGERFIKSTLPSDRYGDMGWCGTSMAAPAASGAVALLLEQFRSSFGVQNPLPSTIKGLLIHYAEDLEEEGPDYRSGYGKIQPKAMVDAIKNKKVDVREQETPSTGHEESLPFTVTADLPELKVTLTWDDAPGATTTLKALVNDLDLALVDPHGQIHTPWVLDPNNPGAPASRGIDRTNIVEQVLVANPVTGDWSIKVKGFAVPKPPQKYSLVLPVSLPPPPPRPDGLSIHPLPPLINDSIGTAGETDTFELTVELDGDYAIETRGPTDVKMSLFGPNNQTNLIEFNDDGAGIGFNAKISRTLNPGTYFVEIRHYSEDEVGPYSIFVRAEP